MRLLLVLTAIVSTFGLVWTETQYEERFLDWMAKFERAYETAELFYRFGVYKDNLNKIEAHNALGLTWTAGENQFTDLTEAEFGKKYLTGLIRKPQSLLKQSSCKTKTLSAATNDTLDWVELGAVTGVKNQGQCGSCWSFSTTGSAEGWNFLQTGKLVSLSEQQLMDCSWKYGNLGCNGGLMDSAMSYLIDNTFACTEEEYPYTEKSSHKCLVSTKCTTHVPMFPTCADVPTMNIAQLQAAVQQHPVSIAIEADQTAFQMYSSGVLTGKCGTNLDHGVLLVGYDMTGTTDPKYWKVKNSWGVTWGEKGYIRIGVEGDECGVQMEPSYPYGGQSASTL